MSMLGTYMTHPSTCTPLYQATGQLTGRMLEAELGEQRLE